MTITGTLKVLLSNILQNTFLILVAKTAYFTQIMSALKKKVHYFSLFLLKIYIATTQDMLYTTNKSYTQNIYKSVVSSSTAKRSL